MNLLKAFLSLLVVPSLWAADLTVICLQSESAQHFAEFTRQFDKAKMSYQVIAAEKGAEELQSRGVTVTTFTSESSKPLKDLSAKEAKIVADKVVALCGKTKKVMIDVGNPFAATILKAFAGKDVELIAYYDNPSNLVEGGYSASAAKVLPLAKKVFFANANLADSPLYERGAQRAKFGDIATPEMERQGITYDGDRYGIGYLDMAQVNEFAKMHKNHVGNPREPVIVYLGGADSKYYKEGFPGFLTLLTEACKGNDFSKYQVIIRQHPRALEDGNQDGRALAEWQVMAPKTAPKITLADPNESDNDLIAKADMVAFYQTSLSPKLVLANVPTMQIDYVDLRWAKWGSPSEDLVKNWAGYLNDVTVRVEACPYVYNVQTLLEQLARLNKGFTYPERSKTSVRKAIGYDENWFVNLKTALEAPRVPLEPGVALNGRKL